MAFGIKAGTDDEGHAMNAGYLRVAVALWIVALVAGGYAESFPNRPVLEDVSEYVAQGIVCGNAVRERELAVSRSQSFLPYCGVWQPYIVSLQQELETLASMYIDHINGPLNDANTDFRYFTLATWRSAAGLNGSGFRRSTDGTSFSYGQMQAGDIIGPWIFEDLQKGFGALKWVPYFPNLSSLKAAFPDDISGYATLVASGNGPNWKGVYYALTYDDSGIIGGSGTYELELDSRSNSSPTGYAGRSLVSFGARSGVCEIEFDCGGEEPPQNYNYSFELELEDSSDVVGIAGIRAYNLSTAIYSSSIVGKTIHASATLSSREDCGGELAMFYAFVYCKVPFTNP